MKGGTNWTSRGRRGATERGLRVYQGASRGYQGGYVEWFQAVSSRPYAAEVRSKVAEFQAEFPPGRDRP